MKKTFILLILGIIFIKIFCYRPLENPVDRNQILFKSSIDSISIAIKEMNNILDSSDISTHFWHADPDLEKLSILIKKEKKEEFLELDFFLDYNQLMVHDYEAGMYIYTYKNNIKMGDKQKDLKRFLVFSDDIRNINMNNYMILDNKDYLFLLALKGAEIYYTSKGRQYYRTRY